MLYWLWEKLMCLCVLLVCGKCRWNVIGICGFVFFWMYFIVCCNGLCSCWMRLLYVVVKRLWLDRFVRWYVWDVRGWIRLSFLVVVVWVFVRDVCVVWLLCRCWCRCCISCLRKLVFIIFVCCLNLLCWFCWWCWLILNCWFWNDLGLFYGSDMIYCW